MSPTAAEVREQLDRILASNAFAGADRARRFLRYVVECTLEGNGDRLKEFAIGVDVFDRGDTYDPRIDSIVRVEAGRLRSRLEQYYQHATSSDAVIVQMRRGSYVPVFERRATEPAATSSENGQSARRHAVLGMPRLNWPGPRLALGVLAIVVVLAAGAWGAGIWSPVGGPPPTVIAVLPFAHFSTEARDELLAARVTDGVTSELVRMDGVSVVARRNAIQFAKSGRPVQEAVQALNADVVVEASLLVEEERIQVDLRLVDADRGRKTWGRKFEGNVSEIPDLQRRVATAVAEAASQAQRP